jgi:S-adenosylmethionine-dependent methyltransferase
MKGDRNFDDIADHFANKVANSFKGRLRRRVILKDLEPWLKRQPLHILDVGGGIGHLSLHFAQHHQVTYVDISREMMRYAMQLAEQQNLISGISWHHAPYQDFFQQNQQSFDVILCHAVLEWVTEPQKLISAMSNALVPGGLLSLCFYNPAGRDMRNLVMGNFKLLQRLGDYQPKGKSLTPQNPCALAQVEQWLTDNRLHQLSLSGIRVFSDYVTHQRGGLADREKVEQMELNFASVEPFNRIGRYLHIVARKKAA